MTPQSVAFAGLHTTSDVLEGAIEFSGPVEEDFGATAPAATAAPLPQLNSEVLNPGHFLPVPLKLSAQVLREVARTIAFAGVQYDHQGRRCVSLQRQARRWLTV